MVEVILGVVVPWRQPLAIGGTMLEMSNNSTKKSFKKIRGGRGMYLFLLSVKHFSFDISLRLNKSSQI